MQTVVVKLTAFLFFNFNSKNMNKEKIKFLFESGLLNSALYEAKEYSDKCMWLFEYKPLEEVPEYSNWKKAAEKVLKEILY